MGKKYCVCLGRREAVLRSVKNRDLYTIVIVDKKMPPPEASLCDYFYHVNDMTDLKEISKILVDFDISKILAVIASGEKGIRIAGQLRDKFDIPGMGASEIEKFRDKALMKAALKEKKFWVPEYVEINDIADGYALLNKFSEVIAKPKQGMGSISVNRIKSVKEWEEYYKTFEQEKGKYHFEKGILLEEFIQGEEFHIDSIIQEGEIKFSYASMYPTPLVNFMEHNFVGTIALDQNSKLFKELIDYNYEVIKALNICDGVTHLECFKNIEQNSEICFCEIALRPAGSAIPENIKMQTNIDIIDGFVAVEIRERYTPTINYRDGIIGSLQIPINCNGRVTYIDHEHILDIEKNIVKVDYFVEIGQEVRKADASHKRIGDIYVRAGNLEEIMENLRVIHSSVDQYVKVRGLDIV